MRQHSSRADLVVVTLPLPKYILVYPSIFKYILVYPSISLYILVYPSISKYIQVYPSISKYILVYPSIFKYTLPLPKYILSFSQISPRHHPFKYILSFSQISSMEGCRQAALSTAPGWTFSLRTSLPPFWSGATSNLFLHSIHNETCK